MIVFLVFMASNFGQFILISFSFLCLKSNLKLGKSLILYLPGLLPIHSTRLGKMLKILECIASVLAEDGKRGVASVLGLIFFFYPNNLSNQRPLRFLRSNAATTPIVQFLCNVLMYTCCAMSVWLRIWYVWGK